MPNGVEILQTTIAVLSVPAVAAAITWLARRFSKESRLTLRLERLAAIYPNLPDGTMRDEFATRVADAGAELSARLDPLFKQERRRKRKMAVWVVVASAFLSLVFPGHVALGPGGSNVASIVLGGIGVAAFLFIESDTRRQRAAIQAEQTGEPAASTPTGSEQRSG